MRWGYAWCWFWIGFNVGVWLQIIASYIRRRYSKCEQCGKRYRRSKSGCRKYPSMFCSEDCNRLHTMDTLLSQGCSVETAAIIAAMEDR